MAFVLICFTLKSVCHLPLLYYLLSHQDPLWLTGIHNWVITRTETVDGAGGALEEFGRDDAAF